MAKILENTISRRSDNKEKKEIQKLILRTKKWVKGMLEIGGLSANDIRLEAVPHEFYDSYRALLVYHKISKAEIFRGLQNAMNIPSEAVSGTSLGASKDFQCRLCTN